jgi:hypothetical protein
MVNPYSSSAQIILPDDLCRNLVREAAATRSLIPHIQMGVRVLIDAQGQATQGDPCAKRVQPIDWKRATMALAARLPANQRRAVVRDILQGVANGNLLDFDTEVEGEAAAAIAAANAAKPRVLLPGQIRVSLGAVVASVQY